MHKSSLSAGLTLGLLALGSGSAQAQVSSYSFQCNRPPAQVNRREFRAPKSYGMQPASPNVFYPSQPQSPAPARLSAWGGTVVQPQGARLCAITSNGPIPCHSVVCIGRGSRYLDQAEVISSGQVVALLEPSGSATLAPGDWVMLVSVPTPISPPAFVSNSGRYHPTSTNADPTYQRWLHQGFTLGGFSSGSFDYRSSDW